MDHTGTGAGGPEQPEQRPPAQPAWGPPGQPMPGQQPAGQQPMGQPVPGAWGPPQPPQIPWQAPPTSPKRTSRVLIGVLVGVLLLGLGCVGAIGYGVFRASEKAQELAGTPVRALPDLPSDAPGATPGSEETEAESKASTYPVREESDLDRVCEEGIYYPQSPKNSGKAPHPVKVLVKEKISYGTYTSKGLYDIPNRFSSSTEKAWDPKAPAKVQLVACVDFVSSGKKVRNCSFDDPKYKKVALYRATYRLTLYEVATGRKLLTKSMAGDGVCPTFTLIGEDMKIYTDIGDRQLYEVLRKHVEK
jgi:hypothetical protein